MVKKIVFYSLLVASLYSCSYFQPSVMFRADSDYQYDNLIDSVGEEYIISKNDILEFDIYAKDGYRLIDVSSDLNLDRNSFRNRIRYIVEEDGRIKLPVIGKVEIEGYTIKEAEKMLEKKYSEFYNNPFVILNVNNRRVIVFPGAEGQATVVPLTNENVTLAEVLALAGGLSTFGKARKVKIIREEADSVQVFKMDLSKMENVHLAKTTMQANDIVYVESQFNVSRELLQEVAPIASIISSAFIIISAINALK